MLASFIKKHALVITCVIFVVAIYGPYVANGGLVIDDYAVVNSAREHPGIIPAYKAQFEQFSNRPLAPLIFSLASNVFGSSARPYIILNLIFWFAALLIISRLIARRVHPVAATLFFLFASVPAFSSTVIFSPAVLLMGSASVLFWAISLHLLIRSIETKNTYCYISSYLLLLCALLSYEATLPLLVITALVPLLLDPSSHAAQSSRDMRRGISSFALRYLLPIALVIAAVLIYQKFLIPHFGYDISRLRFRGLVVIPAVLSKFLFILITDIPTLLAGALGRLTTISALTSLPVVVALGYLISRWRHNKEVGPAKPVARIVKIAVLALLSTILLYFLAGTVPTVHGYDNRGLIGTGVALALILAFIGYYGYARKRVILHGMIGLLLLCALSFIIQRDNYITSARLQDQITRDIASRVNTAGVPTGDIILANVPTYLPENYNNETVFSDEQDAKIGISGTATPRTVIRISKRRIDFGRFRTSGTQVVSDDFTGDSRSAWYYWADSDLNGSLVKVTNTSQLDDIIKAVAGSPAPNLPFDGWRAAVEWSIEKFNLTRVRPYYEQYRARWGYN